MNNLVFYKNDRNRYQAGTGSSNLFILGQFFDDLGRGFGLSVIEELNDPSSEGCSGNKYNLDKVGENIIINLQFFEELPDVIIPMADLIELITQWVEIIKRNPDEIVLIEKDGKYNLKPGPYTLVIHGEK
ncbi:MAG TPA: hypothetical protein VJ201_09160 [Candidatus Babeliales bacterium]|nr:hypothetical protein [Candidatus Babeliales bacterium]